MSGRNFSAVALRGPPQGDGSPVRCCISRKQYSPAVLDLWGSLQRKVIIIIDRMLILILAEPIWAQIQKSSGPITRLIHGSDVQRSLRVATIVMRKAGRNARVSSNGASMPDEGRVRPTGGRPMLGITTQRSSNAHMVVGSAYFVLLWQ